MVPFTLNVNLPVDPILMYSVTGNIDISLPICRTRDDFRSIVQVSRVTTA
jgi:hypothetical protein